MAKKEGISKKKVLYLVIILVVLIASGLIIYKSITSSKVSTSDISQGEINSINQHKEPFFVPEKGFVPDKETAIGIAEAVWISVYGKEQIEDEKPFRATLVNGVWYVTGTLSENVLGGVAIAKISQEDGKIITIFHEK